MSKNNQNDTSKSILQLRHESEKEALLLQIKELELKIKLLESELKAFKSVQKVEETLDAEEIIANKQLEILRARSEEGELTLEEMKKYDLLVKNKGLAGKKKDGARDLFTKDLKQLSIEELRAIARGTPVIDVTPIDGKDE